MHSAHWLPSAHRSCSQITPLVATMSRWTPITAEVTSTLSLSELIDYHLEHNPDHVFSFFPAANPDDQPERVSFLEFGRATQRFARKVCMGGDAPVKRGEIVGIVANVDSLMYMTALGGLVRAGLTVSFVFSAFLVCLHLGIGVPHLPAQFCGGSLSHVAQGGSASAAYHSLQHGRTRRCCSRRAHLKWLRAVARRAPTA
jgi:hypothetical protein